ncbi:MAG: MFS transporter [Chloroflexi bacterium]|nr:MFS transporter [Chloroflexota bacterium]
MAVESTDPDPRPPIRVQIAGRFGITVPNTFRALRHRNYRLYWFGQLISLIGTWMQNVAQPWLVYRLTGSPLALGLVSFSQTVPILALALFGGVVADRVNKHRLIIVTQTVAMTLAGILAVLTFTGLVQVWHVALIAFCLGCSDAFDMPARQVFVAETVGKEDLMNAIALNSTMFNLARIVGPAVAGVLVATLGESGAFALNSLSYLAVIGMLLAMRIAPFQPKLMKASMWSNLKEGLSYIRQDRQVLVLLSLVTVPAIFGMSYSTLMPVFAAEVLHMDASGQGLMLSAAALGSLISALTLASLHNFKHKGWLVTGGGFVFASGHILFSFSRNLLTSMLVLPFVGGALLMQSSSIQTLLQTNVPDQLRGRVMSVYMMTFRGMQPLAGLFAGTLATVFAGAYGASNGAPYAVLVGGSVCLLYFLLVLARAPFVRALE